MDRPDIVVRVFWAKVKLLIHLLKKGYSGLEVAAH